MRSGEVVDDGSEEGEVGDGRAGKAGRGRDGGRDGGGFEWRRDLGEVDEVVMMIG